MSATQRRSINLLAWWTSLVLTLFAVAVWIFHGVNGLTKLAVLLTSGLLIYNGRRLRKQSNQDGSS